MECKTASKVQRRFGDVLLIAPWRVTAKAAKLLSVFATNIFHKRPIIRRGACESVHRGTIIKSAIEAANCQSPSILLLVLFISSRVARAEEIDWASEQSAYRPLIVSSLLLLVYITSWVRLACRLSTGLPSPNDRRQSRVFACFRPFISPKDLSSWVGAIISLLSTVHQIVMWFVAQQVLTWTQWLISASTVQSQVGKLEAEEKRKSGFEKVCLYSFTSALCPRHHPSLLDVLSENSTKSNV